MKATTQQTARPLPFFTKELREAVRNGRKTQTRRPIKPLPVKGSEGEWAKPGRSNNTYRCSRVIEVVNKETGETTCGFEGLPELFYSLWKSPCGQPGDIAYLREPASEDHRDFYPHHQWVHRDDYPIEITNGKTYSPEDDEWFPFRWRTSMTMPREAARLFVEITEVRAERLQDISEEDAIAEGCQCPGVPAAITNRGAFARLWESIYGEGSWNENPWVWVITWKRFRCL